MIEVGHYQIMASIVIITDGAKEKENAGNSLKYCYLENLRKWTEAQRGKKSEIIEDGVS